MGKIPVIQTFEITKLYGDTPALNNVSITVNKGDIYGFVGRNGAGKTTLIRVLCNLIFPNSGTYAINGESDPSRLREIAPKIASMVENPALYLDMTGEDNLKSRCFLYGIKPTPDIINNRLVEVGLESIIGTSKKAKDYSLGMKQRLGIAMALMGDPEILLLDEPTNGLDPDGIKEVRDLLIDINKNRNVTILISSHILSELSKLATRFGFIEKGVLVKEISQEDLIKLEGRSLTIESTNPNKLIEVVKKKLPHAKFEIQGNVVIFFHISNTLDIINFIMKEKVEMTDFFTTENSLEDYFLRLISEVK